jgi:hypothetical protein
VADDRAGGAADLGRRYRHRDHAGDRRVIGETAPLLITLGATTGVNLNPFDGRMASLPVFSYYSTRQPGTPRSPASTGPWRRRWCSC